MNSLFSLETTELKVGFIPTLCSTPLILAHANGLFEKRGLRVSLHAPPGWSGIQQLLSYNKLDAAHVLSPMPLAAHLGIDGRRSNIALNAIQNINGQAITLHIKHHGVMKPEEFKGMTFGVPYAFSMHYYLLCDYLANHGINPLQDVNIIEVAPPAMPAYLDQEWVDGILAPEPFNQIAVNRGLGFIHLLSKDIWDGHPCCAFACRQEFIHQNPNTHKALLDAIFEAESMLHHASTEERRQFARQISGPEHLNLEDPNVAEQVLTGIFEDGCGHHHTIPDRIDFVPNPHPESGIWMLSQMQRWGQLDQQVNYNTVVNEVFQPYEGHGAFEPPKGIVPKTFDVHDTFQQMLHQPFAAFKNKPTPHEPGKETINVSELKKLTANLVDAIGGDYNVSFPRNLSGATGEIYRLLDDLIRNTKFMREVLQDRQKFLQDTNVMIDNALYERIKELRCLYEVSTLLQSTVDPKSVLKDLLDLLPKGWQYPDHACPQILFDDETFVTHPLTSSVCSITSPIVVDDVQRGHVEMHYVKKVSTPHVLEFLPEEQELLNSIAAMIASAARISDVRSEYEDLYQNSPDMLASIDAKTGNVLQCNNTLLVKTGFTRKEIIGQHIFERYHSTSLGGAQKAFQDFVTTGKVNNAELRIKTKEGGFLEVSLNVSAVYDKEGNIIHSRSSWRDITLRKKLERTLSSTSTSFRALLDTMPLGWAEHEMVYNDNGEPIDFIWLDLNQIFPKLTGLTPELVLNQRCTDIIPNARNQEPDLIIVYDRVVRHQTVEELELHFEVFDRWYQIFAFPTSGKRFAAVFLDVTERKQWEREMNALNKELKRSNEELEQFAYVASHDLQEPLRMVSSYTELLAARYSNQLDDKADLFIHHAVSGAKRMQTLISDLLDYSRVGRQALSITNVDLNQTLTVVLNILQTRIDETNAMIEVGELPTVQVDKARIAQVLQNLIGNAIKFSGDAPPHVEIQAHREGDAWAISVKDHGIGIDEKQQGRIFEVFQRLHGREEYEGTGIGLAIVKKLVERHGGTIAVQSTPGEGSTFTFTLPEYPT